MSADKHATQSRSCLTAPSGWATLRSFFRAAPQPTIQVCTFLRGVSHGRDSVPLVARISTVLRSPVPKQSLASSKQNLSCRDVFCVLQINGLCDNVVQLPKPQDYICLPHGVAADNNDLFVCEIYIMRRSPAPSDLCASASSALLCCFSTL
jgi:hypothetical protein